MRVTLANFYLINFVLAIMVSHNLADQRPNVMPEWALVYLFDNDTFDQY